MLSRVVQFVTILLAIESVSLSQDRDVRTGYIVETIGAGGKVVEVIGTYLDFDQAQAAENRWIAGHPNTGLLSRIREGKVEVASRNNKKSGSSEPEVENSGAKSGTIKMPELKWVDVPGSKTSEKETQPLSGKKGNGRIGKYRASIGFDGGEGKGDFVVEGEIKGKGKWVQLGPYLQMESETSKYEGRIEEGKIAGTRRIKKTGEKEEWRFDLEPDVDGGAKPKSDGPYRVYTWRTKTVDTGELYDLGLTFETLERAREYAKPADPSFSFRLERWRPAEIRDSNGKVVK